LHSYSLIHEENLSAKILANFWELFGGFSLNSLNPDHSNDIIAAMIGKNRRKCGW
jgi:hypothetical protein